MVVAKVIDVNMGRHGRQESLGGVVGDVTNKAPVTASERIPTLLPPHKDGMGIVPHPTAPPVRITTCGCVWSCED